jgi:DNA repair photolyase
MNRPGVPAPGFAKRIGPIVDERRNAEFQVLDSADLMNRLNGASMPFDWTVNPYRGCEVGCRYCYARPTHEYLGHADPAEFEERIYVKSVDETRLLHSLRRARDAEQEVRAIARVPGLKVGITTKSTSITRDLPLLAEIATASSLIVNVSLISMDGELLRQIEPRAPRPDLRLRALSALHQAGIPARLFVMPVLPYLTDGEAGLRKLCEAAARAGAGQVIWNVLFLRGATRPFFLEFLRREMPWLVPRYVALYAGGAYASGEYRQGVDQLMERLGRETELIGLTRDERVKREGGGRSRQLALFW